MKEEWKSLKRYKCCTGTRVLVTDLEISNFGNVRGFLFNSHPFNDSFINIRKNRRCIGCYPIYRFVWELFVGPVPKGYVIHHVDFNKLNDRLDNLVCVTVAKHAEIHSLNRSEETSNKRSKSVKRAWKNPEYRNKCLAGLNPWATTNMHWYNNGVIRKMFYTDEEAAAQGFKRGYLL